MRYGTDRRDEPMRVGKSRAVAASFEAQRHLRMSLWAAVLALGAVWFAASLIG